MPRLVASNLSEDEFARLKAKLPPPAKAGAAYDNKKAAPSNSRTASLSELFGTAEPYDYLLMFFGALGGIGTGLSFPFFNVIFGNMLNA